MSFHVLLYAFGFQCHIFPPTKSAALLSQTAHENIATHQNKMKVSRKFGKILDIDWLSKESIEQRLIGVIMIDDQRCHRNKHNLDTVKEIGNNGAD